MSPSLPLLPEPMVKIWPSSSLQAPTSDAFLGMVPLVPLPWPPRPLSSLLPFPRPALAAQAIFLDPGAPTDARMMAFVFARTKLLSRAFARMCSHGPTLLTPFLHQRAFPCPQQTTGVLCSSSPEHASSPLMPFLSWRALSPASEAFPCPQRTRGVPCRSPADLRNTKSPPDELVDLGLHPRQSCRPRYLLPADLYALYFCECVGGICSGCSRYQNSLSFHASVDQARPAESVLSM